MTDFIKKGDDPNTAWEKAKGQYGRVAEAAKIIDDAGLDVYDQVKKIQPICFENACWAYIVGAAIAIKKGCSWSR